MQKQLAIFVKKFTIIFQIKSHVSSQIVTETKIGVEDKQRCKKNCKIQAYLVYFWNSVISDLIKNQNIENNILENNKKNRLYLYIQQAEEFQAQIVKNSISYFVPFTHNKKCMGYKPFQFDLIIQGINDQKKKKARQTITSRAQLELLSNKKQFNNLNSDNFIQQAKITEHCLKMHSTSKFNKNDVLLQTKQFNKSVSFFKLFQ